MNWDAVLGIWDEFLAFMDRVIPWIQFVFAGGDWPQPPFPDFDAEPEA